MLKSKYLKKLWNNGNNAPFCGNDGNNALYGGMVGITHCFKGMVGITHCFVGMVGITHCFVGMMGTCTVVNQHTWKCSTFKRWLLHAVDKIACTINKLRNKNNTRTKTKNSTKIPLHQPSQFNISWKHCQIIKIKSTVNIFTI